MHRGLLSILALAITLPAFVGMPRVDLRPTVDGTHYPAHVHQHVQGDAGQQQRPGSHDPSHGACSHLMPAPESGGIA